MEHERQAGSGLEEAAGEARRHYTKGASLLREKKVDQALQELARAVKLQPQFPEALRAMGLAYKIKGSRDKAAKFLNAAAAAWARRKRFDKAVELFQAVKRAGLEARNPFATLATALHEKGRAEKACRIYEKALELTPEDERLAAAFTRALADAGHMQQAQRFMHSYLAQYPDSEDLLRVKETLPEVSMREAVLQGEAGSGCSVLDEVLQGEADKNSGFDFDVDDSAPPAPRRADPPVQEIVEQKTNHAEKRRSPRIPLADFFLRFPKRKEHQLVVDICREGIGFKLGDMAIRRGQKLQFDLMVFEKVKIKKLHAVVRHVTHGLVGCEFLELSKKQRKILESVIMSSEPFPGRGESLPKNDDGDINFDLDMW